MCASTIIRSRFPSCAGWSMCNAPMRQRVLLMRHSRAADLETGDREYERAQALAPRNPEFSLWHGIGMLTVGRIDDAIRILRPLFARDRNWATLALQMVDSHLVPREERPARDAIIEA